MLQTAPLTANILPSITREFTIKAGRNIGLEILEESLTLQEAAGSDELVIASTTQDIVPVIRFDDKPVANGAPGKYAELLNREFRTFTR
jgi:branched-subunit amino acid aminotransferase/4-amino-4-deoxychorismate lyase